MCIYGYNISIVYDFEHKRKIRNIKRNIYSLPALFILGILLFFAVQNVWSVGIKALQTNKASSEVGLAVLDLKEREKNLENQISSLNSPFGIESEIRKKYGYIKEGEEMVVITNEHKETEIESDLYKESQSIWKKVIDWF